MEQYTIDCELKRFKKISNQYYATFQCGHCNIFKKKFKFFLHQRSRKSSPQKLLIISPNLFFQYWQSAILITFFNFDPPVQSPHCSASTDCETCSFGHSLDNGFMNNNSSYVYLEVHNIHICMLLKM